MKTNYFIIGTAILLASCGNKMLKEAEQAYNNEEFVYAAKIYENAIKEDPKPEAMLHLADCYRHMNRHAEAEKWYKESINSKDATANDKLHYAQVLKEEGKYVDAITMFDAYLSTSPNDIAVKNQRSSCNPSGQLEKSDPFYVVEKTDFGISGSCFSPTKMGNDLLVTASVTAKTGVPMDNFSGNTFFDLFIVSQVKKEDIAASTNGTDGFSHTISITPLPGEVNSNLHEGPAVLSPQKNVLYFTRSFMNNYKAEKAKDNANHLELCTAELILGNWTNIKPLPFNNKEYSVGLPAISSTGTRLFFVSDMPGGYGGTDIYYSDFANGTWGAPVNVGNKINTDGNEMFPSVRNLNSGNDEFYFSSDGWKGAGGLDLFRCEMKNGIPINPERMRAPFNSTYDDFGILFNSDGNSGYLSSNRNSLEGRDNIYSFKRLSPKFFVKVDVHLKGTDSPVPQSNVEVRSSKTGKTEILIADENGNVLFPADSITNYAFTIRKDGFFTTFGSVNTPGFRGKFYDTANVVLDLEQIVINKCVRLENILYDYNKWNIRPEAALELDKLVKLMNDNPGIKVELGSHTDSRGSDAYNLKLSGKRAASAVDYIISKGISRDRITAKGYGEKVPLNRCVNGVKCSEEEFQWNRRTEFSVTSCVPQ